MTNVTTKMDTCLYYFNIFLQHISDSNNFVIVKIAVPNKTTKHWLYGIQFSYTISQFTVLHNLKKNIPKVLIQCWKHIAFFMQTVG